MNFKKLYDLTPKQRAILDWKQARREKLRKEYLNSVYSPLDKKPFVDEGMQRWISMSATKDQYFSGTVWQAGLGFWLFVGAVGLLSYVNMNSRSNLQDELRRGEISYADRFGKFK